MTLWEEQLITVRKLIEENGGLVKTSVLLDAGVTYKTILTLAEKKKIIRPRSGYYSIPDAVVTEEEYICTQFSDGVLTMETGLYYRGYLTERPAEWRIAVSKNISKSRLHIDTPKLVTYFSEESALMLGAEEMIISGRSMNVYTPDRLICDVLKFQERMSKDDVRAAIRAYIDDPNKDIEKLVSYAAKRRVRHKLDSVLGAWINLPAVEKTPRKKKEQKEELNAKQETKQPRPEITFSVLPEANEQLSSNATIVIEPKKPKEEPEYIEPAAEKSDIDLNDVSVAELCYDIYRQMELVEDMSVFHKLYLILTEQNLSGRKVKRELSEICEDNSFSITQERLKKILSWGSDRFMEQKWRGYCKRQDNLSLTWKIVMIKVSLFIIPLGNALVKNEPFTGDWMPDIGRFLD